MDWNAAIEKNREALKRVLAMLVAMAGLGNWQSAIAGRQSGSDADGPADCQLPTADCRFLLPRHLHRAVLRLLRPAEAAARRLVIVAARGMVVLPMRRPAQAVPSAPSPSALRADTSPPLREGEDGSQARRSSFALFDPLRRFGRARPARNGVPRISFPGFSDPVPIPPPPSADDTINAARLALRLAALGRVLDDLPREARRFARWQRRSITAARTEEGDNLPSRRGRVRRVWPLRPGRPPGHRPANRGPRHEVHDILDVTHGLALWALEKPDTS